LSFTTLRIGDERIRSLTHDCSLSSIARLLRASDGSYWIVSGALSGPYRTEQEAEAQCGDISSSELERVLRWRSDLTPVDDEGSCPLCTAPIRALPRHPRAICPVCELQATDTEGRRVCFENIDFSGGLRGRYVDDKSPYEDRCCQVRGRSCRAEEGRFGGVVLQLLEE